MDDLETLLALLNSSPIIDGVPTDTLADDTDARRWAKAHGGTGSRTEITRLRQVRDHLQDVVRGSSDTSPLATMLDDVHQTPALTLTGVTWTLVNADLPARVILEWAHTQQTHPGRLRPCGNDECRLFLLDRSRANQARWCSMATCGNRLKARRHHNRTKTADTPPQSST
ncbi:CGNR zinc finger domain-containing protein [Umezawaea sp. Da 62-37]|uniref:CGNR zinc finger domain-containing protein n=1 Tax=Umezawaea sp. Da 62-37 TaxID=3075927 RepID=UPI0028F714A1|nr:CGNR zinc finger domain-containing protein [Umezawaea sp. Da 62-37]WNV88436.1 CGNR zinc finger domain-containing protein [Umezawaea sp. Da 62-37]